MLLDQISIVTGKNIIENQNINKMMKEIVKLLSDKTVIVTDKETINKLFDSLPPQADTVTGSFELPSNAAMPNSRGINIDGKELYFLDMDEVDFNLI